MLNNINIQWRQLRWPLVISAGLLMPLSLNTPAISQSAVEIAQKPVANLIKSRRLWNQQNIRNYRYTLSNSCFCAPAARGPVIITVKNGIATSITTTTGEPVSNPEFFERYKTIPKLFNVIADAIARKADRIDVQYNRKLGYPTQISIDYSFQQADEELFLTIENFQAL
ncbi:hypothetical protein IQ244_08585 [Nostoc sp. LEGE 06077]|uniref:DUF6174 domain-containing protein n=1 Tax=Nostoc sp. LEGE 06077 TaxID=915325 RepID=UPI0018801ADE|nr:DUF6174 domain-containing protein [Nostoc sp. LEGE 06077]MBE9206570.1 hypothetical protein [Nostoc sp. LEGE 06077]